MPLGGGVGQNLFNAERKSGLFEANKNAEVQKDGSSVPVDSISEGEYNPEHDALRGFTGIPYNAK